MKITLHLLLILINSVFLLDCHASTDVNKKAEIILSTELVKAIAVTYNHFEQELFRRRKNAKNDFARSMSNMKSYEAQISDVDRHYIVNFIPKDKDVRGGAISYFLKKDDYSLSKVVYSK